MFEIIVEVMLVIIALNRCSVVLRVAAPGRCVLVLLSTISHYLSSLSLIWQEGTIKTGSAVS
jgi:hypothetical protein